MRPFRRRRLGRAVLGGFDRLIDVGSEKPPDDGEVPESAHTAVPRPTVGLIIGIARAGGVALESER